MYAELSALKRIIISLANLQEAEMGVIRGAKGQTIYYSYGVWGNVLWLHEK